MKSKTSTSKTKRNNDPDKFPEDYIITLNDEDKAELVKIFDQFNLLKHYYLLDR